ncbi:hypothetical protein FRB94_014064 [Tulasnella sp. JGI-2019a]|nr:hypothetical protein FRB94_014064 [Tulasnella sp. JGI-2019a]
MALKLRGYRLSRIRPTPLQDPSHNFDSLQYLEVHHADGKADTIAFLSFLATCPQLSHLKIIPALFPYSLEAELTSLLPPTSIPHLSSLETPFDLAGLLVQGRPVLSLKLWGGIRNDLDRKFLSRLAGGSTPLRRLDVDHGKWRDDILLDIAECLPTLQDFKLRLLEDDCYVHTFIWLSRHDQHIWCSTFQQNSMLERLASDIKGLPPIQRFVIYHHTGETSEDDVDHDTLKLLAVTNDRLALIGLHLKTERYEYERRWVLLPLSQI